ncbi:hypothetical protein BOX15_Mlig000290g1, partial [Macrostomum lignano]
QINSVCSIKLRKFHKAAMGKKNQQPRTKGNAKPSSSQSAAEFLQRHQQSMLIGFDGTLTTVASTAAPDASSSLLEAAASGAAAPADPGFLPATEEAAQQLDSALDSELHFVLRRLAKKDAVTKQKALAELFGLFTNRSDEALEAALPYWIRLYARLALDSDRRVRELCQPITGELAARLKKRFAPNLLRETLPYWLMAQADPAESVASAARTAFKRAFSEAKRCSAVAFAFDRTLQVAMETLDTSAPLKPSDPSLLDSTNCDFTRLVCSALGCLQYLLNSISLGSESRHRVAMVTALSGQSVWRYSALCQQSTPLSAAHLRLATAVCSTFHDRSSVAEADSNIEEEEASCRQLVDRVAKGNADLAMTCLWSEQPSLAQCGLDATLSLAGARPQLCWNQHAFRKKFLPRLKTFLSTPSPAALGRLLYPSLLPLFSILPLSPSVDKELEELVNLLQLLAEATILNNESAAANQQLLLPSAAFIECARYLIKCSLTASAGAAGSSSASGPIIQGHAERLVTLLCSACAKILTDSNLSSLVPCACLNWLQLISLTSSCSNSNLPVQALLESLSRSLQLGQPLHCALAAKQLRSTMSLGRAEIDSQLRLLLSIDSVNSSSSGISLNNTATTEFDFDWPPNSAEWLPSELVDQIGQFYCSLSPLASIGFGLTSSIGLDEFLSAWLTDMSPVLAGPMLSATLTMEPSELTSLANQLSPEQLSMALTYWLEPLSSRAANKHPAANALLTQLTQRLDTWLSSLVESLFSSADGLTRIRPALHLISSNQSSDRQFPARNSLRPLLLQLLFKRCEFELNKYSDSKLSNSTTSSCLAQRLADLADLLDNLLAKGTELGHELLQLQCSIAQLIVNCLASDLSMDSGGTAPWPKCFNSGASYKPVAISAVEALANISAGSESAAILLSPLADQFIDLADGVWPSDWRPDAVGALLPSCWTDYKRWLVSFGPPEFTLPADRLVATSKSFNRLLSLASCTLSSKLIALAGQTGHIDELRLCLICACWLSQSFANLVNQRIPNNEIIYADIFSLFNRWLQQQSDENEDTTNSDDGGEGDAVVQLHLAAFVDVAFGNKRGEFGDKLRERFLSFVACSVAEIDRLLHVGGREFEALVVCTPSVLDTLAAGDSTDHRLADDTVCRLLAGLSATGSEARPIFGRRLRLASAVLSSERYSHEWPVVHSAIEAQISVDAEFLLDTGEALVDCDQIERIADNATVLACLQSAVSRSDLSKSQWDFALCSLTAWLAAAASLSVDQLTRLSARHPAWRLLCRACQVAAVAADRLTPGSGGSGSALSSVRSEWLEFFAPHLLESQLALFDLTVDLDGCARDSLLARLCLALSSCPPPVLLAHRFPPELRADDAALLASGLTPALQTLLNRASRLAFDPLQPAPVSAAFAQLIVASLPTVAEGVATAAGAAFSSAGEFGQDSASDAAAASAPVPYCIHERLSQFAVPVPDPLYSRLLSAEPVSGASWMTSPGESRRAASQLLNGLTLLHLVRLARPAELRARLAEWLSSSGYFNQLLLIACPLLPANPAAPAMLQPLGADCGSSIGWRCCYGNDGLDPSSLALDLLVLTLRHVPAMFRDWRTGLTDRRLAGAIDKYVRKWVSPVLCQHELRLVQSAAATAFGSSAADGAAEARELTVKARPAAREIVASYQVTDEHSAELLITLPADYPLGHPSVEISKRVGIPSNDWRRWQLQMAAFLRSQNGSLLDGIELWKRNVDKKFEGVEDCMICYSILHGSNYRLPDLQCRVCRKRFHRACMRQWFETSQNPTCPLCRNTFDFITSNRS